jgi:phosphoribosylamine-glycine ligase
MISIVLKIKLLIIGNGSAKDTALVNKLLAANNEQELEIIAVPGNYELEDKVECICPDKLNIEQMLEIAIARQVSLTVVNDNRWYSQSIVDIFLNSGLAILGPNAEVAKLESSAYNFHEFTHEADIPATDFASFDQLELALVYIKSIEYPILIKPDNLFEFNYVAKEYIAEDYNNARSFIESYFAKAFLAEHPKKIVIESYENYVQEYSFSMLHDGTESLSLTPLMRRRVYNDLYTRYFERMVKTFEDDELINKIFNKIINPFINHLNHKNIKYKGLLSFNIGKKANGDFLLQSISTVFTELSAEVNLNLLDENVFDLLSACFNQKLSFYQNGLRHFDDKAYATSIYHNHTLNDYNEDEKIDEYAAQLAEGAIAKLVSHRYFCRNFEQDCLNICIIARSFKMISHIIEEIVGFSNNANKSELENL